MAENLKKQTRFFKPAPTDHGGSLRKKRAGRGARNLTYRHSLHVVLRSSQATGAKSFVRGSRRQKIARIVYDHARRNGIKMISFANVGNHLHLHVQLPRCRALTIEGKSELHDHRALYCRFIRAITGAIVLTVMAGGGVASGAKGKFWDQRPFTRYVATQKHFLNMKDYMEINRLEGEGFHRINARFEIAFRYDQKHPPDYDVG